MKRKEYGVLRILALFFPWLLIFAGFQMLGAWIAGYDLLNPSSSKTSLQHLIIAFSGLIGTFLILWIFMRFIDRKKFVDLGFHIKNRFSGLLCGCILGLLIMGSAYLLLTAIGEIKFEEIIIHPKKVLISGALFIVVALTEEVLFRGYILRNLMSSCKKTSAIIGSSILFCIAHGFNPNIDWFSMLNLFLAGMLLGTSYLYTKNLWFPIGLHFSWNFFQSLFGFNVSGRDFYSVVEYTYSQDTLLNGGAFGFEGSILSVIIQVLLISIITWYYQFYKPKLMTGKT